MTTMRRMKKRRKMMKRVRSVWERKVSARRAKRVQETMLRERKMKRQLHTYKIHMKVRMDGYIFVRVCERVCAESARGETSEKHTRIIRVPFLEADHCIYSARTQTHIQDISMRLEEPTSTQRQQHAGGNIDTCTHMQQHLLPDPNPRILSLVTLTIDEARTLNWRSSVASSSQLSLYRTMREHT
jgi:hypothetical protein